MTTLVGREHDLQRVHGALARHGACVIVGPGGVGKSAVISALVGALGERAILHDAASVDRAEQLLAELAIRLDVDHVIDTGAGGIPQVCGRLAERLSAAGIELLAIDHVDGPSDGVMEVLDFLARDANDLTVLVATRNHPVRPFGEVVRLPPLEYGLAGGAWDSAGAALFRDTFVRAGGDPIALDGADELARHVLASTGGLPLAINVVAARAALVGLDRCDPRADTTGGEIGPARGSDLTDAALERSLRDLDDDAHRIFRTIGTFRSDPLLSQVAAVSGLHDPKVTDAVERLARRSLVEVVGGRVHMLPPVRRLADRLATTTGDRAWLEERFVEWADAMGRADPPPSTAEVLAVEDDLIRAIAASFGGNRLDTVISVAKMLDDAFRADLRHRRRVETLDPVLRACTEAAERDPNSRRIDDLIELMRITAMAHADASCSSAAARLLDDAAALVDRSSRPDQHLARVQSLRAGLAFEAGDLAAAQRSATAAIDCATRAGDDLARHQATKLLADVALETGELDRALDLANTIVREAAPSHAWLRGYALAAAGACELERGALALATAAARQLMVDAQDRGDRDLMVEADWLTAMTDPLGAPARSAQLDGERTGNSVIHIQADIATALRKLAAGEPGAAILVAADCELRSSALPMRSLAIDAQLLVGAAAVLLGSASEATRAYRQVLTDAVDLGYRLRVPDALDGLADVLTMTESVHPDSGAVRGAAMAIRAHLGAVSRPTPWRLAGAMPSCRPPDDWVEHGTLTAIGLQAVLGALAGEEPTSTRAADRLAPLSPAERAVAELVASGLTNREIGESLFVSRRTVETHVAHAFQKLDVRSRTQLAAVVLDQRRP